MNNSFNYVQSGFSDEKTMKDQVVEFSDQLFV